MSMLSSQVDELRELATRYDELQVGAVKAVTMPSNMGSILREAADTIWELRDDLQRTHGLLDDAEHDESMAWDRVRKAEADNAKLRELVRDMYGFIERMDEECGDVTFSDCFDYCKHDATDDGCCKTGECWYEQRMRDLGVEVEE